MSCIFTVTLLCDTDECNAYIQTEQHGKAEARIEASRLGWTYKRSKDYCPTCVQLKRLNKEAGK
jgi:hypothetical protein